MHEKSPPAKKQAARGLFGVFRKIIESLLDIALDFSLQLLGRGEFPLRAQAAAELHPDGLVIQVTAP